MWKREQLEKELREKGWYQNQRMIEHGIQYILTDGTPLDLYETSGRVVVRGKETSLKKEVDQYFNANETPQSKKNVNTKPRRVFIVYGHDTACRDELELMMRRLKLEPIILQNLTSGGDTIIEKLEVLTAADFACVLLTPDDEGCSKGCRNDIKPRARQNVVLELGMVLAKLGRKHVAILVKGNAIEKPSDIAGLIYVGFENTLNECKDRLAACLQEAGFEIQVRDLIS